MGDNLGDGLGAGSNSERPNGRGDGAALGVCGDGFGYGDHAQRGDSDGCAGDNIEDQSQWGCGARS